MGEVDSGSEVQVRILALKLIKCGTLATLLNLLKVSAHLLLAMTLSFLRWGSIRNPVLLLFKIEVSFTYSSEEVKKVAGSEHQEFKRAA